MRQLSFFSPHSFLENIPETFLITELNEDIPLELNKNFTYFQLTLITIWQYYLTELVHVSSLISDTELMEWKK